jgi:predicted transcriptional regulator
VHAILKLKEGIGFMVVRHFLLKRKPTLIILCLKDSQKDWYPAKLAAETGTSYVYVTNWLTKLEKEGWIKFEKKGKLKKITLTEQGALVAAGLDDLVKRMEKKKEETKKDSPAQNATQAAN